MIAQIQNESGARVKLSQNREFFPGTTDRVVLVQGDIEAVENATNMVAERAFGPAEGAPPEPEDKPVQVVPVARSHARSS